MPRQTLRANCLLLLAALIWGSTFVVQKIGMQHIGPFWFTGLRFALGTVLLLPLLAREKVAAPLGRSGWLKGIVIGLILFVGINLQQSALQFATVANTGFITGLYVVLVPLFGFFLGQRYSSLVWLGALLAISGLYLLSVKAGFTVNFGDWLTLISTAFWAVHVLALSGFGRSLAPVRLALIQFATCAVLSLAIAWWREPISTLIISEAALPLVYSGVFSVGIGFTAQVIAQRHARAADSAIILSLEAVVAALTGWLVLHEVLDGRAILGCVLMLIGTLLAQLAPQARH